VELVLAGREVARYVAEPQVDPRRGPRPYLHPVRTLGGVVVTDVEPEDHPHHLGVSVAMQDVNGTNLWGGRTYVRDTGYAWREDHGRIEHVAWQSRADDRFAERLRWLAADGTTLLGEERRVAAAPLLDAWVLDFSYGLTNLTADVVTLGSPGTNGRPGNAGYGGFFWRAALAHPRVFHATSDVEPEVNGSTGPWVAMTADGGGPAAYTLVFTGLGDGDHWFVRADEYPGVCVALAFERVRLLESGATLGRRHRVVVADGARTVAGVERFLTALEAGQAPGLTAT
jgi:hypothetical protein